MHQTILNRSYWAQRVGLILVVILLATVRLSGTTGAIEIIAHRGASDSAPENTLTAVNAAWEQGADAVEVDVHLTADGRIVVIHDPTTTRTTGAVGRVAQLTVEGHRRLTIIDRRHSVPSGEKIPTLAEVVQTVPDGKRLFIDIKCGSEIVPELTRVLRASGKQSSQLVAITWRFSTARAIKRSLPNITAYILRPAVGNPCRRPALHVWLLNRLIRKCYHAGLDGIDVEHTRVLSAANIRYAHQLGMRLTAWTVNSVPEARRLQAIGVDGITTDHPLLMRQQLGGIYWTTVQTNGS
jgi:glycerophosphoryl diester phosphodiesterase